MTVLRRSRRRRLVEIVAGLLSVVLVAALVWMNSTRSALTSFAGERFMVGAAALAIAVTLVTLLQEFTDRIEHR
jgi:hypothetical protein